MHSPHRARAYLRTDCPYSFKFLLFMSEARLLGEIEIVRCDPRSADFEALKTMLAEATGKDATFPTVEIETGRFMSDSSALIEHYARKHSISVVSLPALAFYLEGIFPQIEALH